MKFLYRLMPLVIRISLFACSTNTLRTDFEQALFTEDDLLTARARPVSTKPTCPCQHAYKVQNAT